MKGKTLLSLAIVLAMVLAALPMMTVKAAPTTISVVFENGLNTIQKLPCQNFVVSINIANAPNTDFFDIGVQWDTTTLELQTGTSADVVEGGFMKAFGSTVFPGPSVINVDSMPDIPCGFLSGGPAHGDGTLFTIAFHAKSSSLTPGPIGIMAPNVITYLLLGPNLVPIDATVNGSVTVPIPPAQSPKAIITSPVDGSLVYVGDTVTLDGSNSQNGIDSVPAGEICAITTWDWAIDFHDGNPATHLFGAHQSFDCTGAGLVTITLTVTAPDPTPGDSNYVDHDTSAPISIMQVTKPVGPSIDVYTDRGGQGPLGTYPFGWSDAYGPQEEVCVYAKVTYNDEPVEYKPVVFEVIDNNGAGVDFRTAFTDANGIAKVCFRIPWQGSNAESEFGDWSITGVVDISQVKVTDTVKFRFGYILSIRGITVNGSPLHKGEFLTLDVDIASISMTSHDAILTMTACDEAGVPIGLAYAMITVAPEDGMFAMAGSITIPTWAYVGTGTIYVDLLTAWPQYGGVPYCPEKTALFIILKTP